MEKTYICLKDQPVLEICDYRCRILDALGIPHVVYEEAEESALARIADQKRIDYIKETDEKIVKCRMITSEQKAIVSWEIDYEAVLRMEKPEELSQAQWEGVLERIRRLDHAVGN